ncbi:MAG: flagellar type III secretion system pore protein FliP [Zymomonas mobilis]|uniref:Flagellar biosynthetic protein FliP n=1 Tax=Zymomonas mobilis TaxID=542 RepID=A0A542W0L6_ZYMMB|nr:flagellar type III secretion system pore protein FliP [Zymomonas mobilis]TQL17107.1 flagellar biosynthetic protein FliP [Zymomonas mobilis]
MTAANYKQPVTVFSGQFSKKQCEKLGISKIKWLILIGLLSSLSLAVPATAQHAPTAPHAAERPAPAAKPAPPSAPTPPAPPADRNAGASSAALSRGMNTFLNNGKPLTLSLQILLLMTLMTVLPSIILMMTSFTRIIIVLSLLRQAIGLQQTPPNQVLIGLALFLSLFVMRPVLDQINTTAFSPYGKGEIQIEEAIMRSGTALHGFMTKQTRKNDLQLFTDLAHHQRYENADSIPFTVLVPSFVTSELKTAFEIGFLIFLPFIIIDIVVACTLTALGMMMLSPQIISAPFKLLLFVMVDGWALTIGSLAGSFIQ